MALVTCCSASGSPGVTTGTLGLALNWPRDVLLVDADRDPAQAIAAGFLSGVELGGRGLAHVALAHRDRRPLVDEVWHQTLPLSEGTPSRRFLPGFASAGAAHSFDASWGSAASALRDLGRAGTDVIVDAGRIGRGLPAGLVGESDVALVFVRSDLRALAALRIALPVVSAQATSAQLGLVLVGPGRPYSAREVEAQFGVSVWGELPFEPRQAAVLSDGQATPRGFAGGALVRGLRRTAGRIDEQVRNRIETIDGARDASWWQPAGVGR